MYNQLLFYTRLFDVDKLKERLVDGRRGESKLLNGADVAEGDESKEKLGILLECNRERFETVRGVVGGYLERNGRQWVDMGAIFGFAGRPLG